MYKKKVFTKVRAGDLYFLQWQGVVVVVVVIIEIGVADQVHAVVEEQEMNFRELAVLYCIFIFINIFLVKSI